MHKLDMNADLGEGFGPWRMGDDAALLDVVTTANIACGLHAGDPDIMRYTVRAAKERGVAIGAHPGFADLRGFGRRRIDASPTEIENIVAYQIGALAAIAALEGHNITHVKTHGAMGNMCAERDDLALAVGRAICAVDATLLFLVMPGQATERAAQELGLGHFNEIYADRTYDDSFNLSDRRLDGSVLHDPSEAVAHITAMLNAGGIVSRTGKLYPTPIHSVCVHGDNPHALTMAKTIRRSLEERSIQVTATRGDAG